ncbi:MAG: hypothetical protein V1731_00705 [Candidatus Aenigmatarchaeota archaeon]
MRAKIFGLLNKYALHITFGIFFISLLIIANTWITTGDWIRKSVDLSGGTEITIQTDSKPDTVSLENSLKTDFGTAEVRGAQYGLIIRTDEKTNSTEVLQAVAGLGVNVLSASVQTVGPALGASFWSQAQIAILLAFVFMAAVIYMIYRAFIPTLSMVSSAFMDMIEAIAVMNILGMTLSFAGLAALLMVVGYSVDNEVVLATRTLKTEEQDVEKDIKSSRVTGFTMMGTALAALITMFVFSPSPVLKEISAVLALGLLFDIPNTWLMNVAVMRWYFARHKKL